MRLKTTFLSLILSGLLCSMVVADETTPPTKRPIAPPPTTEQIPAEVPTSEPVRVAPSKAIAAAEAEKPAHEMSRDIHWFRNAAEQRGVYLQTYKDAAEELEILVKDKAPGSWVVSLDADETVISNSQFQRELSESGKNYSFDAWIAWCKRGEATALPGAVTFLKRVHELGGKIAIVTNRDITVQTETEQVFLKEGLVYDFMMCRDGRNDGEKERRWNALAEGKAKEGQAPLEVVMWIGDNIQDFPDLDQSIRHEGDAAYDKFGKIYFTLPNPMYGSWEKNDKE